MGPPGKSLGCVSAPLNPRPQPPTANRQPPIRTAPKKKRPKRSHALCGGKSPSGRGRGTLDLRTSDLRVEEEAEMIIPEVPDREPARATTSCICCRVLLQCNSSATQERRCSEAVAPCMRRVRVRVCGCTCTCQTRVRDASSCTASTRARTCWKDQRPQATLRPSDRRLERLHPKPKPGAGTRGDSVR
jgi:hypothetical protein